MGLHQPGATFVSHKADFFYFYATVWKGTEYRLYPSVSVNNKLLRIHVALHIPEYGSRLKSDSTTTRQLEKSITIG